MPRKPRVDVEGAVYHVTARGNHQQRLFYGPEDYMVYLSLLREAVERFGLRVLAYALLPNHVHFLCRRGPTPLAKVMHYVQRRFALHHNRRLGVRGHAFEDRYHAKLCDNEEYLWAVVRYIHDNPVQAGLCDRPDGYPWTSYHAYASGQWDLVDQEEAANLFGPPEDVRDLPPKRPEPRPAGSRNGAGPRPNATSSSTTRRPGRTDRGGRGARPESPRERAGRGKQSGRTTPSVGARSQPVGVHPGIPGSGTRLALPHASDPRTEEMTRPPP
ncbi:MAG: transposase [Armatimonadota bacterium]|nr:transposase [Armatimonadota bacterium]MDR7400009.1 transposase [Armatimonadota bacterium]MDR7431802.1 transposase [Armatimonadota bacterium]MDR7447286.1 transposase [Armatimonadota bacterium]MDR7478009.1 transposase [Armatimonadota bacterium]